MATITADDFQALMNITDADISNTNAELVIDMAVHCLNLYGHGNLGIGNMAGTAGTKTLSVDSETKGAVYLVARAIWYGFYMHLESVAISSLSVSTPDLLGNPTVLDAVKEAAQLLVEADISIG